MGRRIKTSRPSPAIFVAVLALVAALAGTAVAGPQASTSAINKKKVKKIATKQINKLAPGLSVASAETADTANSAETAGRANSANRADTADTANTANTANTATQAQNAATANGVRPVEVNFAVPADTAPTTLFNQGGLRISGRCDPGPDGPAAPVFSATANDGFFKVDAVNAAGTTETGLDPDFDVGDNFDFSTAMGPLAARTLTLTYRGSSGTTVNGELVAAQDTGPQCVISGTLFVG